MALLGVQGIVSGKMYNRHFFPYGGLTFATRVHTFK